VKVQEDRGMPIWPVSFTIATGLLGAGTLAVGLTEISAENKLADLTHKIPANKKAIEKQRDKATKLAHITTVMGVAAGLSGITAVVLWVLEFKDGDDQQAVPETKTTASAWRPQVGWASVGVERKF
jgi:hypothetical protein